MNRVFILKLSLALSLLILAALPSWAAAGINTGWGEWMWVSPRVQGNTIEAVSFVNANVGWAVGGGGVIMKTTNGGNTWISQTPSSSCGASRGSGCALHGVSFVDANKGWAVGDFGTIWRTANGGNTWTGQTLPSGSAGAPLAAVSFANAMVGVAVGDGTAFFTRDGGATWSRGSGVSASHLMASVQMKSPAIGYAVGSSSFPGRDAPIYKTIDGGASWTLQTSSVPDSLTSVFFADNNRGFAVGNCSSPVNGCPGGRSSSGRLLRTVDGGVTWVHSSNAPLSETLYGVAVAGGGSQPNLITVGANGMIRSLSSSALWTGGLDDLTSGLSAPGSKTPSGVSSSRLLAVDFGSSTTGYAVGEAGVVTRTADAGASWGLKAGGENRTITGSSFINANTGWMVGGNGLVLKTTNGGATWSTDSSGIPAGVDLKDVHFLNATTGFAAGCQGGSPCRENGTGVIYRYDGSGWQPMSITPDLTGKPLKSIHMSDATHGWAVGAGGTVLGYNGVSWILVNNGISTKAILNSVDSISATDGWAAGEMDSPDPNRPNGPGVLYRYSAGAWTDVTPPSPPSFFTSVDMANSSTGYVVGSGGKVYKTTNGGGTWTAQNSPTGKLLSDVSFVNANTGIAVGGGAGDALIMKTTNGGASWSVEPAGTNISVNTVSVVPNPGAAIPCAAYAAGGNSMILRNPDNIAPRILSTNPAANAARVPADGNVSVAFSEVLNPPSVNASTFKLVKTRAPGSSVPAAVSFNSASRTAVLNPSGLLSPATAYTATLTQGIKDRAGNAISAYRWNFTTAPHPNLAWYDYGGATTGLFLLGSGSNYAPRRVWYSGQGQWEWSRSKTAVTDQNGDGNAELFVLYSYGNADTGFWVFDPAAGYAPRQTWRSGPGSWDWARTKIVTGSDQLGAGITEAVAFYDYGNDNTGLWLINPSTGQRQRKWLSGPGNWNWARDYKLMRANFDGDPDKELAVFYDYGNATCGIWLFDPPDWNNPRRVWYSGPGNWEVSRTKLTLGDQNGDGKAEVLALYDYSNANTGIWVFDPAAWNAQEYQPVRKWLSGPGNWDWKRSKLLTTADQSRDGKTELTILYNYGDANTGLFMFDPAARYAPRKKWVSGPGNWDWARSKAI